MRISFAKERFGLGLGWPKKPYAGELGSETWPMYLGAPSFILSRAAPEALLPGLDSIPTAQIAGKRAYEVNEVLKFVTASLTGRQKTAELKNCRCLLGLGSTRLAVTLPPGAVVEADGRKWVLRDDVFLLAGLVVHNQRDSRCDKQVIAYPERL